MRQHLDDVMADLPDDEQDAWAEAFRMLVTSAGRKIALHAQRAQRGRRGSGGEVSSRRSRSLEAQRILRTAVAGEHGGPTKYEIYHDVLASAILDWRRRHADKRAEAQEAERLDVRKRQERKRLLLVGGIAAALALGVVALALLAAWALHQRSEARKANSSATALAMTSLSAGQLARWPDVALRLGLEAYLTSRRPESAGSVLAGYMSAWSPGAVAILSGHEDGVSSVAYSPTGTLFASGSSDGTIRLWVARTRRLKGVLDGHAGAVYTIAFSGDGRTLFSGSGGGKLTIWDVATQKQRSQISTAAVANSLALAPDGTTIVVGEYKTDPAIRHPQRSADRQGAADEGLGSTASRSSAAASSRWAATRPCGGGTCARAGPCARPGSAGR